MSDLNSICLSGRLTRDADLREFPNGGNIMTFGLAVNRSIKKGEVWEQEVSFFNCATYNKEKIQKYLITGKQVNITGYLKQSRWEEDGEKKNRVFVVVTAIQLLADPKTKSSSQDDDSKWGEGYDDEIPF